MQAPEGPPALTRSTRPSEPNVTTAVTAALCPATHACAPPRIELSAVLTAAADGVSGTSPVAPCAGLRGGSGAAGSGLVSAAATGAAGSGSSSSTTCSGLAPLAAAAALL